MLDESDVSTIALSTTEVSEKSTDEGKSVSRHADYPQDGGVTAWLQVLACWLLFMNTW